MLHPLKLHRTVILSLTQVLEFDSPTQTHLPNFQGLALWILRIGLRSASSIRDMTFIVCRRVFPLKTQSRRLYYATVYSMKYQIPMRLRQDCQLRISAILACPQQIQPMNTRWHLQIPGAHHNTIRIQLWNSKMTTRMDLLVF
jgi:hypothetical protein